MADLVPYADLKVLLGLTKAAITDYPALTLIRDSVTAAIANHTGRFILEEDTFTESGFMVGTSGLIPLKGIPIASVASATINDSDFSSSGYKVTAYGLRLTSPLSNFDWSVTYTGAFDEWPADLARAALLQTAYEFQHKDTIGATQVTTDGGTFTRRDKPFTAEVERLLMPFIHIDKFSA